MDVDQTRAARARSAPRDPKLVAVELRGGANQARVFDPCWMVPMVSGHLLV